MVLMIELRLLLGLQSALDLLRCCFIHLLRYSFLLFAACVWKTYHQARPCLLNLLASNHKRSIKKEACWTILNITVGTKDQIQVIIVLSEYIMEILSNNCLPFIYY